MTLMLPREVLKVPGTPSISFIFSVSDVPTQIQSPRMGRWQCKALNSPGRRPSAAGGPPATGRRNEGTRFWGGGDGGGGGGRLHGGGTAPEVLGNQLDRCDMGMSSCCNTPSMSMLTFCPITQLLATLWPPFRGCRV